MWGREDIEWKDRTWRLLESKGQMEVDGFIVGDGLLGGLVAAIAARRGRVPAGISSIVGGIGLGTVVGTGEYMVYRYGIKGGRWPDEKAKISS